MMAFFSWLVSAYTACLQEWVNAIKDVSSQSNDSPGKEKRECLPYYQQVFAFSGIGDINDCRQFCGCRTVLIYAVTQTQTSSYYRNDVCSVCSSLLEISSYDGDDFFKCVESVSDNILLGYAYRSMHQTIQEVLCQKRSVLWKGIVFFRLVC